MSADFFIPEARLASLKATPAGRSAEGGFNYQRAYAIARLAAMHTTKPVLGLCDYPKRMRYDWAEDLDELLGDGSVCFTQCKRVDDIGEPTKLAQVLLGLAPKWLWTPDAKRAQVRFRLVSCDSRFLSDYDKAAARNGVLTSFRSQLASKPSPQSDRAKWQHEADSVGHERLFHALWQPLELLYLAKDVVPNDPVGSLLPAERAALDHLMRWDVLWGKTQKDALARLRCLLHENLITFDPANKTEPAQSERLPPILDAADVRVALFAKEKDAELLPFAVVDRIRLAQARMVQRKRFFFEAPEWHHVVHGADEQLRFIERDQTAALTRAIREHLIAPLLRGTGRLSVLFVTGPPGAGKSTLVRRVAAQLIDTGEVIVADAGHNLADIVPAGVELFVQQLTKLAQQGRPVLLVLDDPLRADSEWIELIKDLKQPDLQLAVVAPTPDFLYHRHQHELQGVQIHAFPVHPPSAGERDALARLYGHTLKGNEAIPNDFLVMVAEAAEGIPFPEIMVRLWTTLNGGTGISDAVTFKELPWEVRAFWFVCALHRTYTPCPLPILRAALELSGGTGDVDAPTLLAKLKAKGGWRIFHVLQPASALFRAAGELVSTAHQRIASVAWQQRLPGAWLDDEVTRLLSIATLRAPASALYVARAAGTLAKAESNPDTMLAGELMRQWQESAGKGQSLETRDICALTAALMITGGSELVRPMSPLLQHRANGRDGWLAALQLRYQSSDKILQRSFPRNIHLSTLIAEGDFSIAPRRATRFFDAVQEKEHREAIISRLCASLDGMLTWPIDSTLMVWLISHAPQIEMISRLHRLQEWLEAHEDDTAVRTQHLAFVMKLQGQFAEQRKNAAIATEKWLKAHPDDTYVRTQYLAFVMKLPAQFAEQRKNAAIATEEWLEAHENDTAVRTQYLAFVMKLPAQFAEQRKNAAIATENWLKAHPDDTTVRTQYLAFVQQLPLELDEMRKQAALKTAEWLRAHPGNVDACTGYVSLLLALRHPDLVALETESIEYHRWIIEKNPKVVGHRFVFAEQLLRLDKFAEAKTEYEAVIAREPQHQLAHRGLAIALQNLGERKEAEQAFQRALRCARGKGGYLARFHTSFGVFYLADNRWLEAIKSFEAAGRECPEYYGNHWGIAQAYIGLGQLNQARQALEKALADPKLRSPDKDEIANLLARISE